IILADGALSYVPFEALVKSPGGADFADLSYLIKSNEIVYAPSASVVAASRRQTAVVAGNGAGNGMLIVADPVFDVSDPRAKGSSPLAAGAFRELAIKSAMEDMTQISATNRPSANWGIQRLEGTRAEAGKISQLTRDAGGQAEVWLDLEASETNVK